MAPVIDEIDMRSVIAAEVGAVRDFENELWLEQQPGEPELTDEVAAWLAGTIPALCRARWWVARDSGKRIIGTARMFLPDAENTHSADVEVRVRPARRGDGIGSALFLRVLGAAMTGGRTLLTASTYEQVPSGERYLVRLGAVRGLVQRSSDLDLARLDRTLVAGWIDAAGRLDDRYELWFVDGRYPQATFADIATVEAVMNTAPRDDLALEDDEWTAERVAERERLHDESPGKRWSLFVRERATGRLVGLTRVWFYDTWPGHVDQGDTGVHPDHRGQGLARWLKAEMIERILRDRPQSRRIRTSNAFSNKGMLAINDALGFNPTYAVTRWQIETAAARAAVDARRLT